MKGYNIWMITKWYPGRDDSQFGVFIQKHARAIALENQISVLYIHSIMNLNGKIEIEAAENSGVNEVIIYFRKNTSVFKKLVNTIRYFIALRKGIKLLNEKYPQPEIIHAYILLRTGIIAWYLSLIKKVPYVISEQWSGYVTGKLKHGSIFNKKLRRFVLNRASAVTAVSSFLLNGMKEFGLKNKNSFIVPNTIEIKTPDSLKTASEKINVLITADLVDEIKNISSVIKMIDELEKPLSFELHIIGHGIDEKKLKKAAFETGLLNKNIFFEGLKSNEEVYEFLQRCDFLVMNSRFETFSLICAEAMSCGKPVIATRCGGPDDFVIPDAGILIEPDNQIQLKESFIYMLENYRNYDPGKIRAHVIRLFSKESAAGKFNEVYKSAQKLNNPTT